MATVDTGTEAIPFTFGQPEQINGKARIGLGKAGMVTASVQFIAEGGDNNLHAHSAEDETFLVLTGRVRFYGKDNEVIAELGPNEGLIVPRRVPYWFESASDEVLTIFKVGAEDPRFENERLNYEGLTAAQVARGDQHPLTGRPPADDEKL